MTVPAATLPPPLTPPAGVPPPDATTVTLTICTWNRCGLLGQTLESLCGQYLPPHWRVLVIDNSCTDDTPAVVDRFIDRLPLRRVVETAQGLSHARNRALVEAAESAAGLSCPPPGESSSDTDRSDGAVADAGGWVLFTDDDVQFEAGYAAAWAEAFGAAGPEIAFLGGAVEPWFPEPPPPALAEGISVVASGFCRMRAAGRPMIRRHTDQLPVGANFAVRVRPAGRVRFDPHLGHSGRGTIGGEEHALFRRLLEAGFVGDWVPGACLRHWVDPGRLRLRYLVRYLFDAGRTTVRTEGVPPGRRVGRVPGWILKELAVHGGRLALAAATGRRVQAFRNLADVCVRAGAFWETLTRPPGPGGTGAGRQDR